MEILYPHAVFTPVLTQYSALFSSNAAVFSFVSLLTHQYLSLFSFHTPVFSPVITHQYSVEFQRTNSGSPEVELRFCPWIKLFKYWTERPCGLLYVLCKEWLKIRPFFLSFFTHQYSSLLSYTNIKPSLFHTPYYIHTSASEKYSPLISHSNIHPCSHVSCGISHFTPLKIHLSVARLSALSISENKCFDGWNKIISARPPPPPPPPPSPLLPLPPFSLGRARGLAGMSDLTGVAQQVTIV
jgi:hypothetical protein